MWIFDRWGNMVYHCTAIDKPWNGEVNNGASGGPLVQMDVYVYKIEIKDIFDKKHLYIGHINLIK